MEEKLSFNVVYQYDNPLMPDSNSDDYWYGEYFLGMSYEHEFRYALTDEFLKNPQVFCCGCNVQIDTSELHVLKTLAFGWHINPQCLLDMEHWLFEEFKKREFTNRKVTKWSGTK